MTTILLLSTSITAGSSLMSSKYILSALTVENGLPNNFIDDISKDKKGFLWISTQGGGVCRYDGYEFVHFNVNSTPISLKSNFIKKTCEDNFNRLWIASSQGIDVINLRTMEIFDSQKFNDRNKQLSGVIASSILKDQEGNIWLLCSKEIIMIDFTSDGSINNIYRTNSKNKDSHTFTTINLIDDEVWVGDNGSIFKVLPNKSGKLSFIPVSDIPSMNTNLYISSILKRDNLLWIGTEEGLYRLNLRDKSSKAYFHDSQNPTSISQNMVTELALTNDGVLVVGTLKGLNLYDPISDEFEHIYYGKSEASLNSDFVNSLLPDGNNLWIGTESGGVNKMTSPKLNLINYIHRNDDLGSISPNPVNAIIEDKKENLWVGTVEGGLNCKMKGSNKFIHFTSPSDGISHNSVSALEEDQSGNLWIGTWGNGFNILDLNKLKQKSFNVYNSPGLDYIAILKYDYINKGMWVGTNRKIFFFDDETRTMNSPLPEAMTDNVMGILGCLIDNNNILWIGTSKGLIQINLLQFDKNTLKSPAQYFTVDEYKISKLFFRNITCIYQSQDGVIWIGSGGYGICKLEEKEGKYSLNHFTIDQGLVNNTIFGILEDEQGILWISTGYGLSSFDPETSRFVNYTKEDGLINDQFYWNASYKSPTSKNLYFGTIGGLSVMSTSGRYTSQEEKKVVFTKLQILNKTVWKSEGKYINSDIAYAKHIDLHEQDKSFSIEFSAMDYHNPSTVLYSYRLLGFEDEWIDISANRRFITYTNLRPGTYTLQVKCMSGNHNWSENISELLITVRPFFYKTSWFIGFCFILIIFLGFQFYRWRVNSFKKQREILHKKVEERTQELKLQNEILVTQNEKILTQRKQILEMSNKVQEATADKISFFTNITHEFRTPISLIIGPIERALKLSSNPKVLEQLHYVSRNSKYLLSLINQLMDFRKIESENMTFNLVSENYLNYIEEMLYPFESYANERGITIKKLYRLSSPQFLFDREATHKLIANLLSNAIKFTSDKGTVSLYIASINNSGEEKLYICVQDTGVGLNTDDYNRIFNRFYQTKGHEQYPMYGQSGTGIGLYLCKKIVDIQGGKIVAKNNHVRGASFRVLLPLLREEIGQEAELPHNIETNNKDILKIETPSKHKLTILVVEDNRDMRKYICSILSDYYKVIEAGNGKEALSILKSETVDFIISDLMMPIIDGLELSKKVKSDINISHIPFLMLTAKTSLDTRINTFRTGADEYLTKPFDEELLLTRISNILENRKIYQRRFSLLMNIEELNIIEQSNDDIFLKKALKIVKENYKDSGFDVGFFIEELGVSKSVLNRKMQTLTGLSAGSFIRNYRLSIAHEIIVKNKVNMNVSEIAYEVGFNDPKYFTRCFTKHFGMSPSEIYKERK